jgi:RNase P/RNase MRP subunit p30
MTYLIQEKDFQKARNKIREAKKQGIKVIFSGDSDELNRKILEKENIDILLLKLSGRKDFSKQRNSGFNQVLAKLSKKKNVSLGVDLDEVTNAEKKEKSRIISRLRQNIALAKKNKLKIEFISKNKLEKQEKLNLKSLGIVLGMPTPMTKEI